MMDQDDVQQQHREPAAGQQCVLERLNKKSDKISMEIFSGGKNNRNY